MGIEECNNTTTENELFLPTGAVGNADTTVYNIAPKTLSPNGGINKVNNGFIKRCELTNFDLKNDDNANYTDKASLIAMRKSYCVINTTTDKTKFYEMWVAIPLSMISELFAKMAPVRSIKLEFNIQCHTSKVVVTADAVALNADVARPYTNFTYTSGTPFYNYTPYMICDEMGFSSATDGAITIISNIGKATTTEPAFGNRAYLHVCMYEMEPSYEETYISSFPSGKRVVYNELFLKHNQEH